ncbi:MAG TPA: hypothetical protein VD704_05200 [Gaiellaceae bacterium]|nr:hypothetical protein [Gaiellaceae bacterium]
MSRLVIVVPLRPGLRGRVRDLLAEGPPFDLESTAFDRHEVFLSDAEAIFVFESEGDGGALNLPGEDPALWQAAERWKDVMADRPRVAATAFAWARSSGGAESGEWTETWGE